MEQWAWLRQPAVATAKRPKMTVRTVQLDVMRKSRSGRSGAYGIDEMVVRSMSWKEAAEDSSRPWKRRGWVRDG